MVAWWREWSDRGWWGGKRSEGDVSKAPMSTGVSNKKNSKASGGGKVKGGTLSLVHQGVPVGVHEDEVGAG